MYQIKDFFESGDRFYGVDKKDVCVKGVFDMTCFEEKILTII